MSNDKEKSAIDVIYMLLDKINNLEKQIKVIDNNIKLLNNRFNKNVVKTDDTVDGPRASPPLIPTNAKIEEVETVKVFGRIKNKKLEPIKGVEIRIFNPKNEVVKSRTTDADGYWEARILPGKYGIEYDPSQINSKLKPANFKITVPSNIKELDISPQQN